MRATVGSPSYSEHKADLDRDLDVLWRFGMREHGLAVVQKLHVTQERFGGRNEFFRTVSQFAVDEFLLAAEYYSALVVTMAVSVIPLRSPTLTEATLAMLK